MAASYKRFFPILTVLLLAFFVGGALASTDSAYVVDRVQVDVTAEDAAMAREQAFNEAQVKAFRALAERLMSDEDVATFQPPDVDTISSLVQDFEIVSEQLSHVRYVGVYRFRFKERAVRDFFSRAGVAHTDVASKPVLIVPFYQWGSRSLLWSDSNPWLAAWKQVGGRRGLVPVVVPIGDLQDMSDISEESALAQDWSQLESMRQRYGAGESLVLLATPVWEGQGIVALQVNVYTAVVGQLEYATSIEVRKTGGETDEALFARAVQTIQGKLQQLWKNMTVVDPGQANELAVRVRFAGMPEWVATKAALDSIRMLDEVKIESLNPREARLRLRFKGDENRLRLALSQNDLTLSHPQIGGTGAQGYYGGYRSGPLVYDLSLENVGDYGGGPGYR
ncbi:MAG: DUF2066 domain-containing protein [Alphaproteobacteria bacterium]|nr:DUF2066 domain-containing protein [Alphaproteobacteria bacterium]